LSKIDIKSLSVQELENEFRDKSIQKYRALQVYKWIAKGVEDFSEMSDLSKSLRKQLNENYAILNTEVEAKRVSKIDGTIKFLFKLCDGEYIESVLMKYKHGYSICISTQVGCKMGCTFCATGKQGFKRNLAPSEMLSQIQCASEECGERISNVVLMGMGEPLDNYKNVLKFLELVSSDNGLNIGMRHISLSTCGIVDKIYDLADRKMQLTLSVSLHAPNDEIRKKTMPVNNVWGVNELLKSCKYYTEMTGRRISFEYAMIKGVNDSDECARELAQKLKGTLSHVNLIPVNNVTGINYKKSAIERQKKFISILDNKGINATVRRTLGSDIEASCGQLKGEVLKGGMSL